MSHQSLRVAVSSLVVLATLASTGCLTSQGPSPGVFSIPIPVSPYFQDKAEDRFWMRERYERVPILPPLTAGGPDKGMDEPSDDEVMRALELADPVEGGVPFLHEISRNNVRILKEKIADYVDPPRVVPLIGPVQLHHVHYKCTVFYTRTVRVGWPIPHTLRDEDTREVLYIDHNHFHMVGTEAPDVAAPIQ